MTDNRPQPPDAGDERSTLAGFLDFHRATLLWKCEGLSAEQLAQRGVPPSRLSLLGLVRHLTEVERSWFRHGFAGQDLPKLYSSEAEPDADFDRAEAAGAQADLAAYRAEIEAARAAVAGAGLAETFTNKRGRVFSLRWVYTHMIEEYARHNGHADLLREVIDGATGE
jgi:uncharacterized damage-inducible protein DinB